MIRMTTDYEGPNSNTYMELGWNDGRQGSGSFFYASIKRRESNEVIASLTGNTPEELSSNLESVGWEPLNSMILAALETDKEGLWK